VKAMDPTLQQLFTGIEIVDASPEVWSVAFESWLASKAENTQRSYRQAWNDLMASAGDEPWRMGSSAIETWIASMRTRDLAESTIAARLAAVSSFFRFACERYTISDQENLHDFNPALTVARPKGVAPRRQVVYLDLAQTRAFLQVIPLDKPQGLRNYAMFLMYIATGRRNSEVRKLQWKDFRKAGDGYQYYWSGKGKSGWDSMPEHVMAAIEIYLHNVGRWEGLGAEDFIFTAISSNGVHLPHIGDEYQPFARPISGKQVGNILRGYAKKAGIDAENLTVHSLRHTSAMLLKTVAKADLSRIQERLGHSSSKTTEIYLHRLEGGRNPEWQTIADALGL